MMADHSIEQYLLSFVKNFGKFIANKTKGSVTQLMYMLAFSMQLFKVINLKFPTNNGLFGKKIVVFRG